MFAFQDLFLIGFLVFLEGILSIDNALVLAILVRPLPQNQHRRALTYGLWGAAIFRLSALFLVSYLMQAHWLKFVGGAYLIFIGGKYLLKRKASRGDPAANARAAKTHSFWRTVLSIELMDIAFAADSILAALAVTRKIWIVFTGGMIGVILLRFAAGGFIKIIDRFPNFEAIAYILVLEIGGKLVIDGFNLESVRFDSPSHWHFWAFWGTVAATVASGFFIKRLSHDAERDNSRPG